MEGRKRIFMALVLLLLLFSPIRGGAEEIGRVITGEGSLYRPAKGTIDLKGRGGIEEGSFLITGRKGLQVAIGYYMSLSLAPQSLVYLSREVKRKTEFIHILALRGRVRVTGLKELVTEGRVRRKVFSERRIYIVTPYGSLHQFKGGDIVVDIMGGDMEGALQIPCPDSPDGSRLDAIAGKVGEIRNGTLPEGLTFSMAPCKIGAARVEFTDFKMPRVRKRMMSEVGIPFLGIYVISGEVRYALPWKKRPSITIKAGEALLLDREGRVVEPLK